LIREIPIPKAKRSGIGVSTIKEKENIYIRRTGMINYGFTKELNIPYGKVVELVRNSLKKEGFGILTEIDVQGKMKEKLGIDMKKYIILGACNPPNAYKAILAEENIGLMLPCNVIVYEKGGKTVLSVIRPTVAMQIVDNLELQKAAQAVEEQLKKAFDAIK
jgi:uncharacterized protein (DUF302 family)